MIKVLLISPLPPPNGGIATWTKQLIDNYKSEIFEIEVLDISQNYPASTLLKKILFEIKRNVFILVSLNLKIRKNNISLIHLNTPLDSIGIIRDLLIVLNVKIRKLPLILHYRCNINDSLNNKIIKKVVFKILSNLANHNIALNKYSYEAIKKVTSKPVSLISNYIDISNFKSIYKTNNSTKHILKGLYVGRISEQKGILDLINIAKMHIEINFILIGQNLLKHKTKKHIPKNISFIEPVENFEVYKHYSQADFFIFLSKTEGFSNSILEAMASKLPIFCTDVGAASDMIDQQGGVIVNLKDDYLVKFQDFLGLRSNFYEMGMYNYKKVEVNYLFPTIMSRIEHIYFELTNQKMR